MLLWLVGGGNEGYEFDELVIREAVKIEKKCEISHSKKNFFAFLDKIGNFKH